MNNPYPNKKTNKSFAKVDPLLQDGLKSYDKDSELTAGLSYHSISDFSLFNYVSY